MADLRQLASRDDYLQNMIGTSPYEYYEQNLRERGAYAKGYPLCEAPIASLTRFLEKLSNDLRLFCAYSSHGVEKATALRALVQQRLQECESAWQEFLRPYETWDPYKDPMGPRKS